MSGKPPDGKPFTFGNAYSPLLLLLVCFLCTIQAVWETHPSATSAGAQGKDPNLEKKADIQKAILESVLGELREELKVLDQDG